MDEASDHRVKCKPVAIQRSHAPWTVQECADLIAGVKSGAEIRALALSHQRSASAIRARLALMISPTENVWRGNADAWLRERFAEEPEYDWLSMMRTRGREPRDEPPGWATSNVPRVPVDRATLVNRVSTIWQELNGVRLKPESLQRFHGHTDIEELICYPVEQLRAAGQRLIQVSGKLLLRSWARECAWPGGGLFGLTWREVAEADPDTAMQLQDLLSKAIASTGRERPERVLSLRLGLDGDDGQTLQAIADIFDRSRERIRQIQDKALATLRRRHRPANVAGHAGQVIKDLLSEAAEQGIDRGAAMLAIVEEAAPRADVQVAAITLATLMGKEISTCKHIAAETRTALTIRAAQHARRAKEQGRSDRASERFRRLSADVEWPGRISPPPPREALTPQRGSHEDHGALWMSEKLGRPVLYESAMELSMIQTLDSAPQVAWYCEQAIAMTYEVDGRARTYYPDLVVATTDGRCVIIEVKNMYELSFEANLAKMAALRSFGQKNGWGFLITDGSRTHLQIRRHVISQTVGDALAGALREESVVTWPRLKELRETVPFTQMDLVAAALQRGWIVRLRPYRLCLPESPTP